MRAILPIALLACLALTGCQNNARLAPEGDDRVASTSAEPFASIDAVPNADAEIAAASVEGEEQRP
jgi:hypothetical protein